MFWACALDERLSETDPAYEARRDGDGDEHGQVLPALRFTRDPHTHQVAVAASLEFTFERSSDSDSPDLLKLKTCWRPLDSITKLTGRFATSRGYLTGRAAYKERLEGQKPPLALGDALDFLNRESQLGASKCMTNTVAEGTKPTISACGLTCSANRRRRPTPRVDPRVRAPLRHWRSDPDVEVFEDRLAEALPDGVSTRDVPRSDRTERT